MSSAAAAEGADAAVTYAPELPRALLDHILEPLAEAGEVAALCVACCISVSWRDAARQPRLWRHLCKFGRMRKRGATGPAELTDEHLAQLVQRATAEDGTHHLRRLDVTGCRRVTARGVALALHGLEGTLSQLRVADILSGEGDDEDVLPLLRACMRHDEPYNLDMRGAHLLCNVPDARGLGEPPICSRMCADTLCEECGIIRCGLHHNAPYGHRFYGTPPCEHVCSDCGHRPRFPEHMMACPSCEARDGDERRICEECMSFCHACHKVCCWKKCDEPVFCVACDRTFCVDCAWQLGGVLKMCNHPSTGCGQGYCVDDDGERCAAADTYLKTASAWAAELQTRHGEDAVAADVIARLLAAAARGEDDDSDGEERVCCEGCALRIPAWSPPEAEEEEEEEEEEETSLPLAAAD
jgi:hypothetical protein